MSTALQITDLARPGTRWSKATIAIIVARFKAIRESNGGVLTAETVLEDARKKSSPLHRFFEWDDSVAAEFWRREQARQLIRQHYVVVSYGGQDTAPTRATVVVEMPSGDRAYTQTVVSLVDEDFSDQVLERAKQELRAWRSRYERFKEMSEMVKEVDRLLAG